VTTAYYSGKSRVDCRTINGKVLERIGRGTTKVFSQNLAVGTGKVVLVHAIKAYRGSRGIAPLILNLCTRWKREVDIIPRPLYPWESTPIAVE
jgi:hypothetical protein